MAPASGARIAFGEWALSHGCGARRAWLQNQIHHRCVWLHAYGLQQDRGWDSPLGPSLGIQDMPIVRIVWQPASPNHEALCVGDRHYGLGLQLIHTLCDACLYPCIPPRAHALPATCFCLGALVGVHALRWLKTVASRLTSALLPGAPKRPLP